MQRDRILCGYAVHGKIKNTSEAVPGYLASRLSRYLWYLNMILGSKGHAFHACMKKHDFLTRQTPKCSHFSQKNERI